MSGNPTLALVVPVFNERAQIQPFLQAVEAALARCDCEWHALFVDDGSSDGSAEAILAARAEGRPVHLLVLARNFGKEAALTAGLDHADADAVVPIDVDLQDPPELLPAMLQRWRAGAEVVLARRARRSEGWFRRGCARVFYALLARLSDEPLPRDVGDFRLLDRRVVEAVRGLPERTRYMKGILSWPGFRTEAVDYDRPARRSGRGRQSLARLVRLALDGIFSFSSAPLRVWMFVGAITAVLALLYMLWIVTSTLLFGRDVPGYASIMTTILFVGGIQILSIGILGEYIARVFIEVKHRPIYVVRTYHGDDA